MKLLKILVLLPFINISNLEANEPISTDVAHERGRSIAIEADARNSGWIDMTATVNMVLRNKAGDVGERELSVQMLEVDGDGDKSVIVFDTPANVRGTALLTHAHSLNPDDQWQYFPALKRVKRISSQNKSGPFMGSEFAYEDMSGWDIDKFEYRFLGEDSISGIDAYILEMTPSYENSGYTKQVVWLDKEYYRPFKVEYFDRKNSLLKTQSYSDYKNYGKYWRAGVMEMQNHQTGKSTDLVWKEYQFNHGFSDAAFEKSYLSRMN